MTKTDTLEKGAMQMPTIDPGVRIGHIHLKVANLPRALDFYCGVLGFELTTSRPGAAFISAGGYHHHLGLNTWESLGGSPPAAGTTGLYHTAILYPTRRLLADALRRLIIAKSPSRARAITGLARHSTCATRTTMALSSTGIGRKKNGRRSPMGRCRCSPIHSTYMTCSPNWTSQRLDVTRRVVPFRSPSPARSNSGTSGSGCSSARAQRRPASCWLVLATVNCGLKKQMTRGSDRSDLQKLWISCRAARRSGAHKRATPQSVQ